MKKLLLIFITLLITTHISAQEIKWSALNPDDKQQAKTVVDDFINAINNGDDLTQFISSGEANFGGELWLKTQEFINFLKPLIPSPIENSHFDFYIFDEIENENSIKEIATKLNRVFNNFSVLANGTINNRKITFVLQPSNNKIKIYSLTIWDIALKNSKQQTLNNSDTIKDLNIAIQIPKSFSEPQRDIGQINYIMEGQSGQDAAIQIMYSNKKGPINILSYKWVEHITSNFRKSEYEISYLPDGYIYKFEIIDQNNNINKGITVGIENNGYSILIQYFALKDVYNKHWIEIDQMIRNIKIL